MSTVVVKIGGALIADAEAVAAVWRGVAALRERHAVVVVHGGGVQATDLTRRLGEEPRILAGRRVTSDLGRDAVVWTVRGELNARLVASAQAAGLRAVGLSGVDGGLVRVERRAPRDVNGETVDFGWVGDVIAADPTVLHTLLDAGFLPVVASPSADTEGHVYNVNADTIALTLADALGADALLLVAEAGGVYRDFTDASSRLATVDAKVGATGVEEGWIAGGMRVKLDVGFEALGRGVERVRICAPDALADDSEGTTLVIEAEESP
jgi:acetylglutamate kinase